MNNIFYGITYTNPAILRYIPFLTVYFALLRCSFNIEKNAAFKQQSGVQILTV